MNAPVQHITFTVTPVLKAIMSLQDRNVYGPFLSEDQARRIVRRTRMRRQFMALVDYRMATEARGKNLSPAMMIVDEVARRYGLPALVLTAKGCRLSSLCRMREEAIAAVAMNTKLTLRQIGMIFDGRDHSSIRKAIRNHALRTGTTIRGIGGGI